MRYASYTHKGNIRELNEDSLYIPDIRDEKAPAFFMAVADGMGGHRAGEVASAIAIKSMVNQLQDACVREQAQTEPFAFLESCIAKTNQKIYMLSKTGLKFAGMGTTLTAAVCLPQAVYVAHLGDSRAYFLHAHTLTQITRDHTMVQEMVENGAIRPEDAPWHPYRHIITRALGIAKTQQIDTYQAPWERGDRVLLCSDGLTTHLSDEEIGQMLGDEEMTLDAICHTMVDLALTRGGTDNVSVCIAEHDGGEAAC